MSLVLVLAMCALVALAVVQIRQAAQGAAAIRRVARLDTTALRDLAAGPVEVQGVLVPLEASLVAPSGRAAVFAAVHVAATRGSGRNSTTVHESDTTRSVAVAVSDGDETTVKLDLEHVEVVAGAGSFVVHGTSELAEATRAWAAAVPAEATLLVFREHILEPGTHVVVSGIARVVDATVDARPSGYRDGAPVEKKTFIIGGTPDARLLVAPGTERQLLWRTTWPVAVLLAAGVAALAYAGSVLALLLAPV